MLGLVWAIPHKRKLKATPPTVDKSNQILEKIIQPKIPLSQNPFPLLGFLCFFSINGLQFCLGCGNSHIPNTVIYDWKNPHKNILRSVKQTKIYCFSIFMEQLINFIIRPPRAEYEPNNDLLDQEFMLKGKWFQRKDLEESLCLVSYTAMETDASEAAIILLPSNITVFTLDFSGSGLSGGEHVSLGWYERDDLRSVVNYLRADGNVSLIGLWGRSMGAVTSLMYGAEDPSIAGMVLDSPFSDLVDLMMELVDTYKIRLPKFTVKFAIQYMRKAILKKAKFDIVELNTIKVAKSSFVPVLFGHAGDDDFIQPHHSDRIYDAYMGDKNIIKFEGDHNSPRPQFYFDSINIFFHNVLQPPEDEVRGSFFDTSLDYLGKVPSDIPSTDKQCNSEDEGSTTEPIPSSSKMINFEFSNGLPYGPHVPSSAEDHEYVEYPLQHVEGFPCNIEEEERMLMEAVLQSLKDLEAKQFPSEQQPQPSSDGKANPIKIDPTHASTASSSDSPSQFMSPCNSTSSSSVTPSVDGSTRTTATATAVVGSSDADLADRTKATVTVERTPSSNIMDGLLRRWDLNFFKNR
ncbi:hypothetical protein Ccrd_004340 [Cynara cardunculus var. scolymus]|uniref:Serine aminopeptidase S33 domain-containing protein n=1 Tax=Cynara cardunculus var. scolymus TaxID=59895 RepID=A0A118JV77_CYNCS|nr:hypothetical protein Ccrd_004340 [Cynara cardunculus var. scolymus]